MEPKIIYEDEFILGLDKPSGLIVHADGRTQEKSLVDWINENYPELAGVGENSGRPGIVHRLDKETSGVIIVAKTQEAFLFIKNQFQNRLAQKVYRAFVWGDFKEKSGVIDKPIGRSASDFRKWSAESNAKGELREAVTEYKILKQGNISPQPPSYLKRGEENKTAAYLEVYPKTGRTHQIRVHMKSINHPVIGDKLYAPKRDYAFGLTRLALHALSIKIELPNRAFINIESELPEEFVKAENLL